MRNDNFLLDAPWQGCYLLTMKNLGKKIREHRLLRGLTLADLSKQSGVALSTLSRIETGKMTGTLESHIQIARALGIRLPELYAELDPFASLLEHRKGSDPSTKVTSGKGSVLNILTSNALHKKMLPAIIHIATSKGSKQEQFPAGTERFLYALRGKTDVTVGGERIRMNPGDSLYFQASSAHAFRCTGGQSILLSLTSPPSV